MKKLFTLFLLALLVTTQAQTSFNYDVVLTPVTVSGLPGLHSYAYGQHDGKWLIIGGRTEGIHARQPFYSFPELKNNTDIYVVDIQSNKSWSASVNQLQTSLKEQLQSSNINFYQDQETLYLVGGYAFANSQNDHKTHNKLTAINVPKLIEAIINNQPIDLYFKQITNDAFAITGGQLGKIGNTFYLVGGHQFDGRYNPMNNPTFTQKYSNQIRKFEIINTQEELKITNYQTITDEIHLHRRDFNMLPQVFPNEQLGYTISSGVFQIVENLPFLNPIDLNQNGYKPQLNFNQYLSNYHSGKASMYDQKSNQMHNLFFGGISQFEYQDQKLFQDNDIPFTKAISCITRDQNGNLYEYLLPTEMPSLKGASAEFIYNKNLPHYPNEVLKLSEIATPEIVIGHLFGGIESTHKNAFSYNYIEQTNADATIYQVKLLKNNQPKNILIDGKNDFAVKITPIPKTTKKVTLECNMPYQATLSYYIANPDGTIFEQGDIENVKAGFTKIEFDIRAAKKGTVILTFVCDNKFYASQKIIK